MQESDVIKAMEAHAADFKLSLGTIGHLAVQNRHAYDRIKKGTAHRHTEERIAAWIKQDRAARGASA